MNYARRRGPARRRAPCPSPPRPAGDPRAVERAAELLRAAERPVFLVGSQLRWSPKREAVKRAADAFEAPFYLNGMARGALPYEHRGLFSRSRKFALAQADCVFVFGTPFDFRVDYGRAPTWAADAKIVQVDLDGAELGRNRRRRRRHRRRQRPGPRAAARARSGARRPERVARGGPRRRGQAARARCSPRSSPTTRRPTRCASARSSASA